jgi:hypothetical protein
MNDELRLDGLTSTELVAERSRVRWKIRILEQWRVRTIGEDEQLRRLRAYLLELMRQRP